MTNKNRYADPAAMSAVLGLALGHIDGAVLVTAPHPDGDKVVFANARVPQIFGVQASPHPGTDARRLMDSLLATMDSPWSLREDLERFWGTSREERMDFLRQVRPEARVLERSTSPLIDSHGKLLGRLWVFRVASAEFEYKSQVRTQRQRLQWLLDFARMLSRNPSPGVEVGAHLSKAALELEVLGLVLVESTEGPFVDGVGRIARPGAAAGHPAHQRSFGPPTVRNLTASASGCTEPEFSQEPCWQAGESGSESLFSWGTHASAVQPLASDLLWPILGERAEHENISILTEQVNSPAGASLAALGVRSLYCMGQRQGAALERMLVVLAGKGNWEPERDQLRFLEMLLEIVLLSRSRAQLTEALAHASSCTKATQEARNSLVALLSHELRTPLHPLVGFTQLLLESSQDLPLESREMVERIAAGAQRLQELVDDLLTITRLDDRVSCWQKYACDLRSLLEEAASSVLKTEGARGVTIERVFLADLPRIRADGAALRKAVRSLLSNALRYSPDNGVVLLTVDVTDTQIWISVEDQGPGIPDDQREHIFEPFVQGEPVLTRRHGGAGIGLTLVKRVAQSHGGKAWVEPGTSSGSRFVLTLPRNPENNA